MLAILHNNCSGLRILLYSSLFKAYDHVTEAEFGAFYAIIVTVSGDLYLNSFISYDIGNSYIFQKSNDFDASFQLLLDHYESS